MDAFNIQTLEIKNKIGNWCKWIRWIVEYGNTFSMLMNDCEKDKIDVA